MNQPLYNFFTKDHRRVENILEEATRDLNNIDTELYRQFRIGMLTHISMEEKVLFKAAQEANGGEPVEMARQLRLEHGAITSLLVPPPREDLIKVIQYVLEKHDEAEERDGGMYQICENLTRTRTEEILETLRNFPEVPVHPNKDIPLAWDTAKRSCARAGFDYDAIVRGDAD